MPKIKIGSKKITSDSVFIIAEAGVNHNGRLDFALKLVDQAAQAGADAIKFQTFKAEELVTPAVEMPEYQKRNTGKTESQLSMLKKLELKEEFYGQIIARCKEKKIIFLSTPHGGFSSVDFLAKLHVPAFKFSSADLTNLPLLAHAARYKKPMIISTGMGTISEIKEAVNCIKRAKNYQIIVLHCTSNYPSLDHEINLSALTTMRKDLGLLIGYSDHTVGNQVPVMAVTLGACVIEKHFTLDRNLPGPDHRASIVPSELAEMIKAIRAVPVIIGDGKKRPQASERVLMPFARKSIVTIATIQKGELFTKNNISIKRPGTGLPPKMYDFILGKNATRTIEPDSLLTKKDYA